MRFVNSFAISTVDPSIAPPITLPRPPVPGNPIAGSAVRALNWKLLFPTAISDSGFRTVAIASCPTIVCVPFEYCARIWPPSAKPMCVKLAGGDPSWVNADTADVWAYCVILGVVPSNSFQLIAMSAAPDERPVTANVGTGSEAVGLVKWPLPSNVNVPVTGVIGLVTSELGKLKE